MSIVDVLKNRISRTQLIQGEDYTWYKLVNNEYISERVGVFERAFMQGFGDGTTLHMVFNRDGKTIQVDEDMRGIYSGKELSFYRRTT